MLDQDMIMKSLSEVEDPELKLTLKEGSHKKDSQKEGFNIKKIL